MLRRLAGLRGECRGRHKVLRESLPGLISKLSERLAVQSATRQLQRDATPAQEREEDPAVRPRAAQENYIALSLRARHVP